MKEKNRGTFTGSIGFVMAAAGSAVGLGNIWRFPYLAAKDNGGFFVLCYIILALTFGFALLVTEIALGRKTHQSPLTAYGIINKKFKPLGTLATLVPALILPYYCSIGGWVVKYFVTFITNKGADAAGDTYFTDYITGTSQPIIFMLVFLALTSFIVISGVKKGIEKSSKILMPILLFLIVGISIYALTIDHTADDGTVRTGLDGLKVYLIPNFSELTVNQVFITITDAMGQLFFSISVAMGIMVTYGSYVDEKTNLMKSVNQIEIFDTIIALLAGLMIVPTVYVFMGKDGMAQGPGLMFVSLPKVFAQMGAIGKVIGVLFFVMVIFAALTSCVSIMEAIVSSIMDRFGTSRKITTLGVSVYALIVGTIVCLGYNKFYFELSFPNGSTGQILDVLDYLSNSIFMPLVALVTCVLFGWVDSPKTIIGEVTKNGEKFGRKTVYIVMVKYVAPVLLFVLLLQSLGIIRF